MRVLVDCTNLQMIWDDGSAARKLFGSIDVDGVTVDVNNKDDDVLFEVTAAVARALGLKKPYDEYYSEGHSDWDSDLFNPLQGRIMAVSGSDEESVKVEWDTPEFEALVDKKIADIATYAPEVVLYLQGLRASNNAYLRIINDRLAAEIIPK